MKKRLFLLIVLVVSLSAMLASAQEPGSAKDNACYEGGTLAGRCENALHWNAGWYLARWEALLLKREDVPLQYVWVLPPPLITSSTRSASLPAFPSAGCVLAFTVPVDSYVNFMGGYIGNNLTTYDDAACSNPVGMIGTYVYAPTGYNANALCISTYGAVFSALASDPGTSVWFCG